jgi:ankyrin repeat protein
MNWQDFDGQTCLHVAAMNPNTDVMVALLSKIRSSGGAKFKSVRPALNMKDHGHRTALHWACALGHAGAAKALLTSGADASATDVVSARPLHYAALNGHLVRINVILAVISPF